MLELAGRGLGLCTRGLAWRVDQISCENVVRRLSAALQRAMQNCRDVGQDYAYKAVVKCACSFSSLQRQRFEDFGLEQGAEVYTRSVRTKPVK